MIAFVKGTVDCVDENYAVIDSGGIGYKIFMSPFSLSSLKTGDNVKIHTFLKVAEDLFDLYGFLSVEELKMFKMIISVSGAGPKAGLSVLSSMRPSEFALAVVTDDYKSITKAVGVGPKLAQKIALELKDKLKNEDLFPQETSVVSASAAPHGATNSSEAVSALCVLGYSQSEAVRAVSQLSKDLSTEDTIKEALKILALR
ncbi:MAG: Holliday junction branch migration protein RuvA [Ruminococcaceae bacterium]|nr:Holliday junction branch migration protein RuvA [Oscillospiraceae bacterium]